MDEYAASLDPKTPAQRQFASAAVADAGAIEQTRLLISLQLASPVSWPLVVIVVSWALILFCGFGLLFRINATTLAALAFGAFAVGARCSHSRAEPTLHRRFSGAVRRLRSDAGVVGQIEAPHAA